LRPTSAANYKSQRRGETHPTTDKSQRPPILQSDNHHIPEEHIRRHKAGDSVSARYFKEVLLVSECNGHIRFEADNSYSHHRFY
jgi:hypothetical protein